MWAPAPALGPCAPVCTARSLVDVPGRPCPRRRGCAPQRLQREAFRDGRQRVAASVDCNTAVAVTAWDVKGFTGLEVSHVEVPRPGEGEVLVQWTLRPVNPADISLIQGWAVHLCLLSPELKVRLVYQHSPGWCRTCQNCKRRLTGCTTSNGPVRSGLGLVRSNGGKPGTFRPGQRVICIPSKQWSALDGQGTWQTYSSVPTANLVPVPDWMCDNVAAQCMINPLTAYGMLSRLELPEGGSIVQSASSSALGRFIIALARHRGYKTINIVRHAQQKEALLNLGADAVFCSASNEDTTSLRQYIREHGGAHGGLDAVGGQTGGLLTNCVRPGGRVLIYGALSGPTIEINILDIFLEKKLQPFTLRQWMDSLGGERDAVVKDIIKLIQDGVFQPIAGQRFKLQDAAEAAAVSIVGGRGGAKVMIEG